MKLNVLAIKTLMAEQRVNGVELSQRTGLTKTSVSLILARGTCTIMTAGKIAEALGTTVDRIAATT